jgi:Macrocin-O-methyltransferase (TylF)
LADTEVDPSRYRDPARNPRHEIDHRKAVAQYFEEGVGNTFEKIENFPKYVSRQNMSRFLALYEIFKKVLYVHGDVIECGVHWGGGLMSFALMSSVLEPVNLQRHIIGFDTFEGFASVTAADAEAGKNPWAREGGLRADSYEDLQRCIELYDANRFISHVRKVSLVKGDATKTIPEYLKEHPQTVVSLLHLDFDLYEPTKVALETFVPRMPRGAAIVFDELNNASWPGETLAVLEVYGLRNLRIERFPFEPHVSYAVIE